MKANQHGHAVRAEGLGFGSRVLHSRERSHNTWTGSGSVTVTPAPGRHPTNRELAIQEETLMRSLAEADRVLVSAATRRAAGQDGGSSVGSPTRHPADEDLEHSNVYSMLAASTSRLEAATSALASAEFDLGKVNAEKSLLQSEVEGLKKMLVTRSEKNGRE